MMPGNIWQEENDIITLTWVKLSIEIENFMEVAGYESKRHHVFRPELR